MKLETKLTARFVSSDENPSTEDIINLNKLNVLADRITENLQFAFRSLIINMVELKREDPNA